MKALYALVGMKHRGTERLVASLPQGEPLILKREPLNDYDQNAVQVWARGEHLGYVRAAQNRKLAMAMDGGVIPAAKLAVSADRWPMIEIEE